MKPNLHVVPGGELDRFMQRSRRTAEELRAAFDERARVHEDLTRAGVPPGELRWRVAWLVAQARTALGPWSTDP